MPAWEHLWHQNSTRTPAGIRIMEWYTKPYTLNS